MSIASSLYAGHANFVKQEWKDKLEKALIKALKDNNFEDLYMVIKEIKEYRFTE